MILDAMGQPLNTDKDGFINRRDVLKAGLVGMLASAVPLLGSASNAEARTRGGAWRVSFRQAHTGERYDGVYRVGNRYLPEAFEKLNYVLRDFRTGEVFPMDPRVIDILSMIQARSGNRNSFEILSGYRSPKTNSNLRNASSGVAKNSFHMYGQALDVTSKSISSRKLRDTAKALRAGGVGFYPRSGFIHIDTGAVRTW